MFWMKYIFITGGVVSSLGKGLAAAALGALLEKRGFKITLQKFDPYLNLDPGTMNPLQHGEVYVLEDGSETDLDLGHYERFTEVVLGKKNSLSSGQVYAKVLEKERKGDYLGQTVQVIPHITQEIKDHIYKAAEGVDIVLTEIGGTTGDIEGLPFLEAMRQFTLEVGKQNVLFIHVTLLPYMHTSGELKTKPSQHSVMKLREIGIQPDILLCRTEYAISTDIRKKLSLFCNVPLECVIEERDVKLSVYELPLLLHKEGLDHLVMKHFNLADNKPDISTWEQVIQAISHPKDKVRVGLIGKYLELHDSYKSVIESLKHGGIYHQTEVEIVSIDAEALEHSGLKHLEKLNGILIPGGFGGRGIKGKIIAAQYAREHRIPFFGICLGLQIAVIEFAQNVLKLDNAYSTEFDSQTKYPVINLISSQDIKSNKGASMRLGSWTCKLEPLSKISSIYQQEKIEERHRHRYGINPIFEKELEKAGLTISSRSLDTSIAEAVELKDHPWYLAVQFHPEFKSKPHSPHPLFKSFIEATLKYLPEQERPIS